MITNKQNNNVIEYDYMITIAIMFVLKHYQKENKNPVARFHVRQFSHNIRYEMNAIKKKSVRIEHRKEKNHINC